MPNVFRTRVILTGWQGGPGVNTLHFTQGLSAGGQDTADDIASSLDGVYTALRPYLVDEVVYVQDPVIDEFEEDTGSLVARYSITPFNGPGTGTASIVSRATMAKMQFKTDVVWRNRLIAGGSFVGPTGAATLDGDGSIKSTASSALVSAWDAVVSGLGANLAVWSQPKAASGGNPAVAGRVGDVVGVSVKSLPAVLRSRRD